MKRRSSIRRRPLLTFLSGLLPGLLTAFLAGCDAGGGPVGPDVVTEAVVVANGGNFGDQNGFLTLYDPETGEATALENLGAFAQSLTVEGNLAYVALNTFTTGRVDVVDLSTRTRVGTIAGLAAPRYVAVVGEGPQAYATSFVFGANGVVSALDVEARAVTGTVEVGAGPEGIAVLRDRVYVANYGQLGDGTTLSVLDAGTGQPVGQIPLGCDGPKHVFVDEDLELAVVCSGKTVFNEDFTEVLARTPGQIVFVDPDNGTVLDRIGFDVQLGSSNFTQGAYHASGARELYAISGDAGRIYRVDTATNTVAASFTVPEAGDLTGLTAVAYDAPSGRLYLGRFARGAGGAPDVAAAGAVVILDRSGALTGRFTAGPSPSHIEFFRPSL